MVSHTQREGARLGPRGWEKVIEGRAEGESMGCRRGAEDVVRGLPCPTLWPHDPRLRDTGVLVGCSTQDHSGSTWSYGTSGQRPG